MKKKMQTCVFRNFPVARNKWNWKMKMSMCIFGYFQWLEQIINIDEKKKFGAVTWVGLLPK